MMWIWDQQKDKKSLATDSDTESENEMVENAPMRLQNERIKENISWKLDFQVFQVLLLNLITHKVFMKHQN